MRIGRRAVGLLGLLLAGPALADDADARDRLIDLATIEATHDLCQFDLSDAQEVSIAKTREHLLERGAVTETDIADVQDEIMSALTRQVSEGLCKPGGAGERLYRNQVKTLTPDGR